MPKSIVHHTGQRALTQQNRQKMLLKFAHHLVAHSFVNTSLDDFAGLVHLSRASLAETYFPKTKSMTSKEHLLRDVLHYVNENIEKKLQTFQDFQPCPLEKACYEWGNNILEEMQKFCITFPAISVPFFMSIEYYGQNHAIDHEIHRYYQIGEMPLNCFFGNIFDHERASLYTSLTLAMLHGAYGNYRHPQQPSALELVFDKLQCDWESGTLFRQQ